MIAAEPVKVVVGILVEARNKGFDSRVGIPLLAGELLGKLDCH